MSLNVRQRNRSAGQDAALARLVAYGGLLVLTVAALSISFVVSPAEIESGQVVLSPPCLMRRLFSVSCPTCGLTRAFCAMSHGEFDAALEYHSLSPLFYAAAWLGSIAAFVGAFRAGKELGRSERGEEDKRAGTRGGSAADVAGGGTMQHVHGPDERRLSELGRDSRPA